MCHLADAIHDSLGVAVQRISAGFYPGKTHRCFHRELKPLRVRFLRLFYLAFSIYIVSPSVDHSRHNLWHGDFISGIFGVGPMFRFFR